MSAPLIPLEYRDRRRITDVSRWVDDGLYILGSALLSSVGDGGSGLQRDQALSTRSRFITLSQAAMKSRTSFSFASSHA